MQLTVTLVDAHAITVWDAPHGVREPEKVQSLAAAMDADPDKWIWTGPPLVADIDAGRLYTGTHRQAALQQLDRAPNGGTGELAGWQIPVIRIWDLLDYDKVEARRDEDSLLTQDDAIAVEMTTLAAELLAEIGWDRQ
jgi:hypothetical protein